MAKVLVSESNLTNIANAIRAKNGSSDTYTPAQMAEAIEDISTGIVPTGSISITTNGEYNVTDYANASVNVVSGSQSKFGVTINDYIGDIDSSGVLQKPSVQLKDIVFNGVQKLAQNSLQFTFDHSEQVRSITFPDLVEVTTANCLQYAFQQCSNLQQISFPLLNKVLGSSNLISLCSNCANLTTIDFPSLKILGTTDMWAQGCFNNSFYQCKKIENVSFPLLEQIWGSNVFMSGFTNCSALESVSFPSLESINGRAVFGATFTNCAALTNVSFPLLKTIGKEDYNNIQDGTFKRAFSGCRQLTSIQFPELEAIYTNTLSISDGTFQYNANLQKIYFPKLTTISKTSGYNSGDNGVITTFKDCSSLQEIHFAAQNQSAIESLVGYSDKWGAPSTCQILFDL